MPGKPVTQLPVLCEGHRQVEKMRTGWVLKLAKPDNIGYYENLWTEL